MQLYDFEDFMTASLINRALKIILPTKNYIRKLNMVSRRYSEQGIHTMVVMIMLIHIDMSPDLMKTLTFV